MSAPFPAFRPLSPSQREAFFESAARRINGTNWAGPNDKTHRQNALDRLKEEKDITPDAIGRAVEAVLGRIMPSGDINKIKGMFNIVYHEALQAPVIQQKPAAPAMNKNALMMAFARVIHGIAQASDAAFHETGKALLYKGVARVLKDSIKQYTGEEDGPSLMVKVSDMDSFASMNNVGQSQIASVIFRTVAAVQDVKSGRLPTTEIPQRAKAIALERN